MAIRSFSLAACLALVCADFVHPGVLYSSTQLDFIKKAVEAKSDPVWTMYNAAVASRYAELDYKIQGPPTDGVIDCGSYSKPDLGCSEEDDDASAAVTQLLLFNINGNAKYAANAVAILNAYGHGLQKYTNSNGPLQAGWGASKWGRAAELALHTPGVNWAASDAAAFADMLTKVSLPMIENGSDSNGNWELSMLEGLIGIAVFTNNTKMFDRAVQYWQERVPAYFYTTSDGDKPVPAPRGRPSWYGMTTFNASSNGVAQETCRDFGHTSYGIAATFNVAETALIQGVNLYNATGGPGRATFSDRLAAALEFHAQFLHGAPAPHWLCDGKPDLMQRPTFEVGYTALSHRLGIPLPKTLAHLEGEVRTLPSGNVDAHMMIFETLTHGGGCAGCAH